jgi:wyosine [tRNA(Phe)-imidazoG37] synthetase (radical SAM superfamily)
MIERFFLDFNGRIDVGGKCMMLCSEDIVDIPGTAFCETAQESMERFQRMRGGVITESKNFIQSALPQGGRKFTTGCAKCANYRLDKWQSDGKIHYVNLSMYPAPCQCKCIYCGVPHGETGVFSKTATAESYEKMFDAIDYARESDMIAADARWQVSSGEITIHPYKDRILDLVKNQAAVFFTNCFVFDEKIAKILAANPLSTINLSIDSGTSQTWFKIKGVDNFESITENLAKYHVASMRPGQITLKYIILPGLNDNYEDYLSVIEIMKVLHVSHLNMARDIRIKYVPDAKRNDDLVVASAYLIAMLHKNKMTFSMGTFSPAEREQVVAFAKELLQADEV